MVCPEVGISKTRQFILENSPTPYALMFDDDMNFGVRDKNLKLSPCSPKDMKNLFSLLSGWLDEGLIHVGISQRFGNNRIEEDYTEITRMNNAYAYNAKTMRKLKKKKGIGFDWLDEKYGRVVGMEDFSLTLKLLSLGYKNRVTYKYCWSQRQSGDDGGCAMYRDSASQKEDVFVIAKEFPGIVKPTQKTSKVLWKGFDSKTRWDVTIQWKKSFKTGLTKKITEFI
jgi:hypothetical protein